MPVYRCRNYGGCPRADSRKEFELPPGAPAICPELKCQKPLESLLEPPRPAAPWRVIGIAGVVVLLILGAIGALYGMRGGSSSPAAVATSPNTTSTAGGPLTPPVPPPTVVLRLVGSNTIGSKLAPDLVAAFLKKDRAIRVLAPVTDAPDDITLTAVDAENHPISIHISAHGSKTAFAALAQSTADVGMASRPINDQELQVLSQLGEGNMTELSNEHVIGIDGIAVIVNKSNPLSEVTKDQLAGIFSGRIRNWAELKAPPGPIHLYVRNDQTSGTVEIFQSKVLGAERLDAGATHEENSEKLSDLVARDPNGIGFIGLPFIRDAKALAVSETGLTGTALVPTAFTVATEDYPLSRRLYLYTATEKKPVTQRFMDFVESPEGQSIVAQDGFVNLAVKALTPPAVSGAPQTYQELTRGARRLSVNFRFRSGSVDMALDNKAKLDIGRVVEFLSAAENSSDSVTLIGFADGVPSRSGDDNQTLSVKRAKTVAEELRSRGVNAQTLIGFGSAIPVASDSTAEGRERNRRVEIWISH